MTVHFGARLELATNSYESVRATAALADSLGFNSIWLRDHVSLEKTTGQRDSLETWTLMAALARDTSRVLIGSLVLAVPFRNPALLAKMASTLSLASDGRVVVGLGAANIASEFIEYGYEFPGNRERLEMLDEAAQMLRLMWTEHRPGFEGKHFRIVGALNEPKGNQPVLLIGAHGPRALDVVARRADWWNLARGPAEYAPACDQLDAACEAIGRDPASLRRLASVYVIVDHSEANAQARYQSALENEPNLEYLRRWTHVGTPEFIAGKLRPYLDRGVDELILFTVERRNQADNLQAFAEGVAPLLR